MNDERHSTRTVDDIRNLRDDVDALMMYRASREAHDIHLTADVLALTTAVNSLQSTIDKSRGAIWVIGSISAGLVAIAAALAAWLSHR